MPADPNPKFIVDFPTLGFLAADWIEAHCPVPDGFRKGQPFEMYDWQLWCTVNHYRVRVDAKPPSPEVAPATAFFYRRSQIVAPQKIGKGPWSATIVLFEALGPCLFAGWAKAGDVYRCAEHGCDCGWEYEYEPGEPMGMPWPTPLIQLLASSEDQVENVYRPLQVMAKTGPLRSLVRVGEQFVRLPNDGLIEVVTASALSRLGNPIVFVLQDESGLYTKQNKLLGIAQTMRRGAAGMGGRSMETTNAWDPSSNSYAQQTSESSREDIFRFHRVPPAKWRYTRKDERRRIHAYVYAGARHVDLNAIEAEAAELVETDPTQAERFFGNRVVVGGGSFLEDGVWERAKDKARETPPAGTKVSGGFDGSDNNDWTAIRLETIDGFRFTPTYGPDGRPTVWNPAEWGGKIPRLEVDAAWDELSRRYQLERVYCDPRGWQTEIDEWATKYGDEVFFTWETYRVVQMHAALDRYVTDMTTKKSKHDTCSIAEAHVANARRLARPGDRYILGKPSEHQKIDVTMADVLAHEAAADAREDGWGTKTNYVYILN